MITLASGEMKMIHEIKVGDSVMSSDKEGVLSAATVVSVPHSYNMLPAEFIHITTKSGGMIF